MKNLRRRFEIFCYKNRNKGIPNLMLYICIATVIVYFLSMVDQSYTLYNALCFNRTLILQGQIWRLFTYIFTYGYGADSSILLVAISLFCYYSLGRAVESAWGTLRFNLFYLTGILLLDAFAMIVPIPNALYYAYIPIFMNLSLFLAYATMYPDSRFYIFFVIPIRGRIFALIDLGYTILNVISLTKAGLFPFSLIPLVAIANYFIFFGKDVLNILPDSWRRKLQRKSKPTATKKTGTIPFTPTRSTPQNNSYTHKCIVCGRTDESNPELEFRYCSRCRGYHCYCEDHITNHAHIE